VIERIHFPLPPSPENASAYAEQAVAAAREIDRVDLDYSAGSLETVDRTLGEFHLAGVPFEITGPSTFAFGCYLGEVVIRSLGGRWARSSAEPGKEDPRVPLVVALPDGRLCDPIGAAFERLESPEQQSVARFFQALHEQHRRGDAHATPDA
jgi:hypothetical protein